MMISFLYLSLPCVVLLLLPPQATLSTSNSKSPIVRLWVAAAQELFELSLIEGVSSLRETCQYVVHT